MNNNIYSNQELLKHKLFLEQLFLLDIEPKETLDRNLESAPEPLPQHLDEQHSVAASQTQAKTSINPISVYALAVTLLLLLPSNRDRVNGKTVIQNTASQIEFSQDQEKIKVLEAKLLSLESKTQVLALEIATNSQQKPLLVTETVEQPTISQSEPSTEPSPIINHDNLNQRTVYQPPSIPIPIPTQRAISTPSQPSSLDGINALPTASSQPMLLPVSALPTFSETLNQPGSTIASNAAQLPAPPPIIESVSSLTIEDKVVIPPTIPKPVPQPAEQWLGQTDVVYYSHSFRRQNLPVAEQQSVEASEGIPEQSLLSERDLNQYLVSTPLAAEVSQLNQQSADSDSPDSLLINQPFAADENPEPATEEESVPAVDSELSQQQSLIADSEDLDLAQYLDSTPLFEEQPKSEIELSNTISDLAESQEPSLFSDQDLAQYLSSTPLLEDKIVRQTLGTSPSTESEAQHLADATLTVSTSETVITQNLEPTPQLNGNNSIQPIAADQSPEKPSLFADEDLKQFLTSTPLFSDEVLNQKLN